MRRLLNLKKPIFATLTVLIFVPIIFLSLEWTFQWTQEKGICALITCAVYEWNEEFIRQNPQLFPISVRKTLFTFPSQVPAPRYLLRKNLNFTDTTAKYSPRLDGFPTDIRTNAHGFRGPELSPYWQDAIRIFALGESTTFSSGGEGESYPDQLRALLAHRYPGTHFEVVNAGLIGSYITDHKELVRQKIADFRPHFILYYSGHNAMHFTQFYRLFPTAPPEKFMWQKFIEKAIRHSELLSTIAEKLSQRFVTRTIPAHAMQWNPKENGLAEYHEQLLELAKVSEAVGARLVLATLVTKMSHSPLLKDSSAEDYKRHQYDFSPLTLEEKSLTYQKFNALIRDFAKKENLTLVDFEKSFPNGNTYFLNDLIHFSLYGNWEICRGFADALDTQLGVLAKK